MLQSNRLIITLAPDRLTAVHAKRGRVHQSESVAIDPSQWDECWSGGLMALDSPLRQLLSRFAARKVATASLIYHSPTLTKQILSFDQGGAIARDTARSKLREAVGFRDPVEVCVLGKDAETSEGVTLLAYSDREESLRSLYALLNRCGVRINNMIPLGVMAIMTAAKQSIHYDNESVVFYLDSDVSVVAHSRDGKLSLVRPADIGYRKLAESYSQAFATYEESVSDGAKHSFVKNPFEPMSNLFHHGVPFQSTEYMGIDLRSVVLPCMAPVLQRIGIDVKQTIRFGIGTDTTLKNLYVCGPGAAIPGINKAIGEHIELNIHLANGSEADEPLKVGGAGSIEQRFVQAGSPTSGILPSIANEERTQRKLSRALVSGGALAAIVMAGEYAHSTLQVQELNRVMQAQSAQVERVNAFEEDCESAQDVAQMIGRVAKLVTENIGDMPAWDISLIEIAELVDAGVQIREIRGENTEGLPMLHLDGIAIVQDGVSAAQVLDGFVSRLGASDSIRSVSLGATSRISMKQPGQEPNEPGQWGIEFSLRLNVESEPSRYERYANIQIQQNEWSSP